MDKVSYAVAGLYKQGLPLIGAHRHEIELLDLIDGADVLHLSGGGYLTGRTLSRLWDNMLLIGLADILSTPVIFSGQTIGLFRDSKSRELARWGLSKAKLIYLRDPSESAGDIYSLGIKGDHIRSTFDDALFCEKASKEDIDLVLKKNGIDDKTDYTSVNVHYFGQNDELSRKVMKRIAQICDYLVADHNIQVVFIPLVPSDVKAMEEVKKNMSNKSVIINYDYDYKITKGIISKSVIHLTMKHHGIIFAMAGSVPTIAMALDDYYVRKNSGALRLFGQEERLVTKEDLFPGGIFEKTITDCLDQAEDIKNAITSHLKMMQEQDGETIRRFLNERKRV